MLDTSGANPLWKSRRLDENLKCVQSIHSDEEIEQHNIDILKNLYK